MREAARELGLAVEVRQTDDEAGFGWLHEAADGRWRSCSTPAADHTSVALRRRGAQLTAPLVEVHISNVHAREEFRHHSYLSGGGVRGDRRARGRGGTLLALRWLAGRASQ